MMNIVVHRCKWCGREIVQCPSHCTFSGWKHMVDGKHVCEVIRTVNRRHVQKFIMHAMPLEVIRT